MSNDFEIFNIIYTFLYKKAKSIIINLYHGDKEKNNYEINLLREKYYSHLTYLEQLAKHYGELGYISKLILQSTTILGLAIPILLINNNILSFLILFSLPFFWFLESQYTAMEKRFQQLVKDLENAQKQLDYALKNNLKLEYQLETAIKKNTAMVNQLEESQDKIQQLQEDIQKKFEVLESSSTEIYQITKDFIELRSDNIKNGELLLNQLNQACSLIDYTQMSFNQIEIIDEELQKSIAFTKNIEEFIQKNFSDFLKSYEEPAILSKNCVSSCNA